MDVTKVAYTILAPISICSGVCFLVPFAFVPRLRKPPNSLIIWQMLSQTIFDLHWLSALYHHECRADRDAKPLCEIIGAVGVYGYFLAFMYTACMSWVIIRCLREPIREKELRHTTWLHHILCHCASLAFVSGILAGEGIGDSVMATCFLKTRATSECGPFRVTLLIPMVLFTPLILGAVTYAFLKHNQRYKRYIIRHLSAVLAFSGAWFPVALLHFWNEREIGNPNHALKYVIESQTASVLGSLSGFLTVVAMLAVPELMFCYRRSRGLGVHMLSFHEARETTLETFTMAKDEE